MTYALLSRHRTALMGFAMLAVMMFHVPLDKRAMLYGLVHCGNIGVDWFLFLSGVGLWFSWTRRPTLLSFYRKRLLRIYPLWLLAACLYYIPDYVMADGGSVKSPTVVHLMANILVNWSFWRIDDGAFWFIPCIMALYVVAPFYMMLIRRHPVYRWLVVVAMVWAAMVQYLPDIHESVGHIEIFWSRIPIFLLGLNCGQWVQERRTIEPQAIWLLLLTLLMSGALCFEFEAHWRGRFPLFLERMVYIPYSVSGMFLLALLLDRLPRRGSAPLAFMGGISLELYLVHAQFVLRYLTPLHLGYLSTLLLLLAISIPVAWVLSLLGNVISRSGERMARSENTEQARIEKLKKLKN